MANLRIADLWACKAGWMFVQDWVRPKEREKGASLLSTKQPFWCCFWHKAFGNNVSVYEGFCLHVCEDDDDDRDEKREKSRDRNRREAVHLKQWQRCSWWCWKHSRKRREERRWRRGVSFLSTACCAAHSGGATMLTCPTFSSIVVLE